MPYYTLRNRKTGEEKQVWVDKEGASDDEIRAALTTSPASKTRTPSGPPADNPTIGPSMREEPLEEMGGDPNIYEKAGLNVEGESDGARVVDFLTKMLGVASAPGAVGAMPAVLGATTGAELLAGAKAIGVPAGKAIVGGASGEYLGQQMGAPRGAGALVGGVAAPMVGGNPVTAFRNMLAGRSAEPGVVPAPTSADMQPKISFRDFVDRLVAGFKSGYQQPVAEEATATVGGMPSPAPVFGGGPKVNPFDEIVARLNQPAPAPLPAPAPKPGIKPPAVEDGKWVDDIQTELPPVAKPWAASDGTKAGSKKLGMIDLRPEPKPATAPTKKVGIAAPKIEPTGEAAKPVRKPAAPRAKKATAEEPTAVGPAERKKLAAILKNKEGMTSPEVTAATNAEGTLAEADAVGRSAQKLRTQMLAEPAGSPKIESLQKRIAALEEEQMGLEHKVTKYLTQQQTRAHLPGIRR